MRFLKFALFMGIGIGSLALFLGVMFIGMDRLGWANSVREFNASHSSTPAITTPTPTTLASPRSTSSTSTQDSSSTVGALMLLAIAAAFYFLPTIIAARRAKRNGGAICVLNLLLGWTFLGWVIALVWALTVDTPTTATT